MRFHGFVSEAEKIELLRRAWANLFPSPKEGWGITVVEAAACGTPSIASDSPGLRDSVRHGETGYLVPHGDVDAPGRTDAGARRRARPLVAALGAGARRFAEGLTWERTAADTERHLHDIIAGSGRGLSQEELAMQTTITARHCEISDALRERALTVVERLGNARPPSDRVDRGVRHRGQAGTRPSSGCTCRAARCSSPGARRTIIAPPSTAPRRSCAASSRRRSARAAALPRRSSPRSR